MAILLELILQFLIEFLIIVVPDLGLACLAHTFKRPPLRNPVIAAMGYGVLGVIIGGISLLIFPASFAQSSDVRLAILILAPIAAGFLMAFLRVYREKRGKPVSRIESFIFGAIIALGISSVRYVYASHQNA